MPMKAKHLTKLSGNNVSKGFATVTFTHINWFTWFMTLLWHYYFQKRNYKFSTDYECKKKIYVVIKNMIKYYEFEFFILIIYIYAFSISGIIDMQHT